MKPEGAIEMLERIAAQDEESGRPDCVKAEQLGIEALKRIDDQRNGKVVPFEQWLPGETEE